MSQTTRGRVVGLAKAAVGLGAVPAPRGGETVPETLSGDGSENPDPLDLPAGLHPVGGRPTGMPRIILPGEKLPAGMQHRAVIDAVASAATEAGLPRFTGGRRLFLDAVPDQAAVCEQPDGDSFPLAVQCYLTGHNRAAIRGAMIDAIVEAARSGHRPTRMFGGWMDAERRARWGEITATGPRVEGLSGQLAAAAGDDSPDGHIGQWFQRVAGRLAEAAYDAGAPVSICGTATRPSGFQVKWFAAPPTQMRTDPDYEPGCGFNVDLHAYEPAEFVDNVIDAILYGNFIDEGAEEHARLRRHLWAAAVAKCTPVPETPPDD